MPPVIFQIETDAKDNTTTRQFDALNRETTITDPLGKYTVYAFDSVGNKIRESKSDGGTTLYRYDNNRRMIAMTDPLSRTTTYTLDPVGNQIGIIPPAGAETGNTYNPINQLIASSVGTATTYHQFDAVGNETTLTRPGDKTTVYEYNALGQQISMTDADNKTTTYAYDIRGNKTVQTETSLTVWYAFDGMGREIKTVDSDGRIKGQTKDSKGRTTSATDINGAVSFNYDANSRLIEQKVSGETSSTFGYDANGSRVRFTQSNSANTAYGYDTAAKLTSLQTSTSAGVLLDYSYEYGDESNISAETGSEGTQTYEYDESDELIRWKDPAGKWATYSYDPNGNRTQTLDTNQTTMGEETSSAGATSKTWISETKLAQTFQASASGELNQVTLFVDKVLAPASDMIVQLKDVSNGYPGSMTYAAKTVPNGNIPSYAAGDYVTVVFDSPYTVTAGTDYAIVISQSQVEQGGFRWYGAVSSDYPNGKACRTTPNWDWEDAPNVADFNLQTFIGSATETASKLFSYDTTTNQLSSMVDGSRTYSYTYDAAGNLTTVSDGTDTTTYAWSGDNRLASINSTDTSASFAYDSEGKRLSKTINGVTTKFVYDDIKLIAEKDGSGTVTAKYFYDDSGQLVSMKKGNQTYYFHLNHRGDVIKITDASQTVVAEYSYDPWGNILSSSGSFANQQPFRYASYFWDSEIGMYYLINRYYDPAIGRFISKDPAEDPEDMDSEPQETNPYAYGGNNPVMSTDPDGLRPTIQYGSRGEDVRFLQRVLLKIAAEQHREYEPNYAAILNPAGGADGVFGWATNRAVKAFQGVHLSGINLSRLAVDGVVGPHTWSAIEWWNINPGGYGGHNDFYGSSVPRQQQPSTNPGSYWSDETVIRAPVKRTTAIFRETVWHAFGDFHLAKGGGLRSIDARLKTVFEGWSTGNKSVHVKWYIDTAGNKDISYGHRIDVTDGPVLLASSRNMYFTGGSFMQWGWKRYATGSRMARQVKLIIWSDRRDPAGNAPGLVHSISVSR